MDLISAASAFRRSRCPCRQDSPKNYCHYGPLFASRSELMDCAHHQRFSRQASAGAAHLGLWGGRRIAWRVAFLVLGALPCGALVDGMPAGSVETAQARGWAEESRGVWARWAKLQTGVDGLEGARLRVHEVGNGPLCIFDLAPSWRVPPDDDIDGRRAG